MRHAPRRDPNERAIIDGLRARGFSVQQLDGKNIPDLLVGKGGKNWLVEIKRPPGPKGGASEKGQHLSEGQLAWQQAWRGQVATVNNLDDAILVCW